MIIEYISLIDIIKNEREEYEYIYKAFDYDDINYSIFFIRHKYLFNIDPDYSKIRIIPILIRKMVDKRIVYNKQECK